jgi:hypothetical protein
MAQLYPCRCSVHALQPRIQSSDEEPDRETHYDKALKTLLRTALARPTKSQVSIVRIDLPVNRYGGASVVATRPLHQQRRVGKLSYIFVTLSAWGLFVLEQFQIQPGRLRGDFCTLLS